MLDAEKSGPDASYRGYTTIMLQSMKMDQVVLNQE